MQGDRTFDNYFGSYPGADGPPATTCQVLVLSRPKNGCVKPFEAHGRALPPLAAGRTVLQNQVRGGRMDGFVAAYGAQGRDGTSAMAYYDRRYLPFSWSAADQYVLFDRFFSSTLYGTRDNRSYWVAAAPPPTGATATSGYGNQQTIFDRLQASGVSWKFYVQDYDQRQTFRAATPTSPVGQAVRVPLLNYPRFVDDAGLRSHIVDLSTYYRDLARGTLPAVSYIASSGASERSGRSIAAGQKLVQDLTTQLMLSKQWDRSALLWTYDGSGGWFDHVRPPKVAGSDLGLRVPALLVSPYARKAKIDHTVLDYTSVLRFIEDNWALKPLTARDKSAHSFAAAFDFSSPPRAAAIITTRPPEPLAAVEVTAAYWAYGAAAVLGLGALVGAAVLPRRPGSVLLGALQRLRPALVPPWRREPPEQLVNLEERLR
jgi:phospholipase C